MKRVWCRMKVIFIGKIVSPQEVTMYSGASVAGNSMMWSYVKALTNEGHDVHVLSSKPYSIKPFLRSPKFIKGLKEIYGGIRFTFLGTLNLPFLREIILYIKTSHYIRAEVKKEAVEVLISYNATFTHAVPVLRLKAPKVLKVAIVADTPRVYIGINVLHNLKNILEVKRFRKFQGLLPITESIINDFAPNVPYELIEGGYEEKVIEKSDSLGLNPRYKHLVYAGAIDELSGLDKAIIWLKTYKNTPIMCHFFGKGPLLKAFINNTKGDVSFVFHGFVPPEEIPKIYTQADVLILPRLKDSNVTKYTFPSKLIGYMSASKPVICHQLHGIPKSYYPYLNIVEETELSWHDALDSILLDECLKARLNAEKGLEFLKRERTWKHHGQKLTVFFEKLINKEIQTHE